jgi:peptide deformylase
MQILRRTQFGNPILRTPAKQLSKPEILSPATQDFIADMRHTLEKKRYGVGLAAPQVGQSIALAIIGLKPTPTRPKVPTIAMTLINPKIMTHSKRRTARWEGCISGPDMYGKAMRYPTLRLTWIDEQGYPHEEDFKGLLAQIIQHEVDHLNGILFVDRVRDSKTYVTFSEYKKIRRSEREVKKKQL